MQTGQLYDKVTAGVPKPTAAAVQQAVKARAATAFAPEQRHLRNIVVKTQAQAADVLRQAKAGASFSSLAAKYSLDNSTRSKGGDIGTVTASQLDPGLRAASVRRRQRRVLRAGPRPVRLERRPGRQRPARQAVFRLADPVQPHAERQGLGLERVAHPADEEGGASVREGVPAREPILRSGRDPAVITTPDTLVQKIKLDAFTLIALWACASAVSLALCVIWSDPWWGYAAVFASVAGVSVYVADKLIRRHRARPSTADEQSEAGGAAPPEDEAAAGPPKPKLKPPPRRYRSRPGMQRRRPHPSRKTLVT